VSVRLAPLAVETTKIRYFHFDVADRRNVDRANIGGWSTLDTTEVCYDTAGEVTHKSYDFSVGSNTNAVRVKVYGKNTSSVAVEFRVYIDNSLVASATLPAGTTTVTLVIDHIGSLAPGSRNIQVRTYAGALGTRCVSKVGIVAGRRVDSTTPVTLVSLTGLYTEYTLAVNGNFGYKLGVRYWIKGNRKTTATATVTSNLSNEVEGYHRNLEAGDDDGEIWLVLRTGDFRPDPAISMAVGTSGDVIIVTGVYVQVTVSRNISPSGVRINEHGSSIAFVKYTTIDGSSSRVCWAGETRNGSQLLWCTDYGTNIQAILPYLPARPGTWIHFGNNEDSIARFTPLLIDLVVIAQ